MYSAFIFIFIPVNNSIKQTPFYTPYLYPPPGYFYPPPNLYSYPFYPQPPFAAPSPATPSWPTTSGPYPAPGFPPFVPAEAKAALPPIALLSVTPPTMMPDPESESSRLLQLGHVSAPSASVSSGVDTPEISPFGRNFQESLAQASRSFDRVLDEAPKPSELRALDPARSKAEVTEDVGSWKSLLDKVKGEWRAA